MSRGFTLLEMIVTVAILGLLAGISGLALRSLRPPPEQALARELEAVRQEAIRSGRPITWSGEDAVVRFLPNGSSSGGRIVVGAATATVDPLTGAIHAAR